MRLLSPPVALAVALTAAAPAPAAEPVRKSPDLWATVNICDTAAYPDMIGIRGSMPRMKRRTAMSMRFRVHYLAAGDGKWHNVTRGGDSGWIRVRPGGRDVVEAGRTFEFRPPEGGGSHILRGAVTFRWKRRGRVVEKVREITESGHRSTKGADPPGFSAATCSIS